jgi:hypothetical protein
LPSSPTINISGHGGYPRWRAFKSGQDDDGGRIWENNEDLGKKGDLWIPNKGEWNKLIMETRGCGMTKSFEDGMPFNSLGININVLCAGRSPWRSSLIDVDRRAGK